MSQISTPARHPAVPPSPPLSARPAPRGAALVAGAGLLLMAVLAGVGNLVVLEGLVTPGDPARTAADIAAAESLFRLGVAALHLVVLLDVVVAWGLFHVFRPAGEGLSQLAAVLRVAYAAVFLVALAQLAAVPRDLDDGEAVLLRVEAFGDTWSAGLLLFGVHLLLVGVLAWRSGFAPRWLGAFVALAGAGYAFDSLAAVLSADPVEVAAFTFVGEVLLAFWLLHRGSRDRGTRS